MIWGIILADTGRSLVLGAILIAVSAFALLIFYRPLKAGSSRFILLAVPFLIAGFTLHSLNRNHCDNLFKAWEHQKVAVHGRVLFEPEFLEGKTRFILDAGTVSGAVEGSGPGTTSDAGTGSDAGPISGNTSVKLKNARIRVTVYAQEPLTEIKYGSMVELNGEIKLPQGRRNIGGFDMRRYLYARRISGTMAVSEKSVRVLEDGGTFFLKRTGYVIRDAIIKSIAGCLPEKEASVLSAMLIGYTADMPEEMEESFRRAGIAHILVVSGANIAFLLAPLLWLLGIAGFNRRWASLISFPLMIFYVFATGMEASVVRAAIMAGVILIGMVFWRRSDVYCSLAVSAILILLTNTYMIYDLGFILSFLATLSIAVFYKSFHDRMPDKIPQSIRGTVSGTLAAQLGVVPVIAYNFNTFSVISLFSNILAVPLAGLLTVLGAVLAIAGNAVPPLGRFIGRFTRIAVDLLLLLTESVSKISWAEINLATPSLVLVILCYLLLLYLRYVHRRLPKEISRPLLAGILVLYGTSIVFMGIPDHSLKIYFTDVGQGDCALIRTPEGKNIMIDGGGSANDEEGSYVGERIVVPLLYDVHMTEIDLMIATHGHADHIGGLKSVIDALPVKKVVVADAPDREMNEFIDYAKGKRIPLDRVKEGQVLYREGDLAISVLYPLQERWLMPQSETVSANELSLVARLDYGKFSALFTADIGSETENLILNDGAVLQCDLLKVAHHGSKYSSDKSFLGAVSPSVAVISVGNNNYGHPSPETIERLEQQDVQIYQTLENGGVLVEVHKDDTRMRVTTFAE